MKKANCLHRLAWVFSCPKKGCSLRIDLADQSSAERGSGNASWERANDQTKTQNHAK